MFFSFNLNQWSLQDCLCEGSMLYCIRSIAHGQGLGAGAFHDGMRSDWRMTNPAARAKGQGPASAVHLGGYHYLCPFTVSLAELTSSIGPLAAENITRSLGFLPTA